ncbi:MAG: DUF805 domain-containing protein [Pseudomonadota bacterium]
MRGVLDGERPLSRGAFWAVLAGIGLAYWAVSAGLASRLDLGVPFNQLRLFIGQMSVLALAMPIVLIATIRRLKDTETNPLWLVLLALPPLTFIALVVLVRASLAPTRHEKSRGARPRLFPVGS